MCVMISFYTVFMIFMLDAIVLLGSWYVFILAIFKYSMSEDIGISENLV